MAHRNTFSLNQVHARRCDVEQHVHQVVVEKVYLVYIQEPVMSPGNQSGFEGWFTRG
jgi:hypothetical protein